MPVVYEYDRIPTRTREEFEDLKDFALANQTDRQGKHRPVLQFRNGQLYARNYVGILETRSGTVFEILPKLHLGNAGDDAKTCEVFRNKTREVFLKMLRTYRGMSAQLPPTRIAALRHFNMLEVFVRLFLNDLVSLTQRGLARHYERVEDNLGHLRGRILFPQHIRHNAANAARFYVSFDEFTANRPVNRLIHTTIHQLYRRSTDTTNRQLLHQLRIGFAEVPQSSQPEVDWQRHRLDRSMRHYQTVMDWIGLFLFNHGLATFVGKHVNQALLFPMEEVFEDFLVDSFRRYQKSYPVVTQGPRESFACIRGRTAFQMKPDIALLQSGKVRFIVDAKWKRIDGSSEDPKHGISQEDIYQIYAYGRRYGCAKVALVYPRTPKFDEPLRYEFQDRMHGQPLTLLGVPFDVEHPEPSVAAILRQLDS